MFWVFFCSLAVFDLLLFTKCSLAFFDLLLFNQSIPTHQVHAMFTAFCPELLLFSLKGRQPFLPENYMHSLTCCLWLKTKGGYCWSSSVLKWILYDDNVWLTMVFNFVSLWLVSFYCNMYVAIMSLNYSKDCVVKVIFFLVVHWKISCSLLKNSILYQSSNIYMDELLYLH